MSTDRVAFIPWDKDMLGANYTWSTDNDFGAEITLNEARKGQTHHKRKWTAVYRDTPNVPLKKVGMGLGTRINIQGHGKVGSDFIEPPGGSMAGKISAAQVAERLEDKGLPKRYVGTISCDVCHSADGQQPFAKVLARELWKRGYKATCVLGYTGELTSTYGGNVQARTLTGKYLHRTATQSDGTEIKSKDAQIRFFGFT